MNANGYLGRSVEGSGSKSSTRFAADLELAHRDPALPGLALLLDADRFAAVARAALPQAEVGTGTATYVRYKPGTSCLVAYRLHVHGVEIDAYARAYRASARDKLKKARERIARGSSPKWKGFVLDDVAIAAFFFPNDSKLDTLTRLAAEPKRGRLFSRLLPNRPALWGAGVRSLRYKPERRYVAAMTAEGIEQAVLKLYTAQEYTAARRGARAFGSRGALQVARPLGRSDRYHALVFEWMAGRALDEVIAAPDFDVERARLVGAALAALHSQRPRGLSLQSREAEVRSLLAAAAAVTAVCPHLTRPTRDLVLQLAADLRATPLAPRAIHGDFSADQVLLTGEGVAILDLDNAAYGDPAADLGTFVAQLERNALRNELSAARVEAVTDALLLGYDAAERSRLLERLELYVAVGLLRLAPHAFRNREECWPLAIEAILERAATYHRRFRAQPRT